MIKAIVCLSRDGGIGLNGKLLFDLPKDLAYFAKQTKGGCVVMGRTTYESLPFANGLPDRKNIVLSTTPRKSARSSDVVWLTSGDVIKRLYADDHLGIFGTTWIIGGASIYKEFEKDIDEWRITLVDSSPEADTYFEPDLTDFELVEQECVSSKVLNAQVGVYRRINNEEK